MLTTSLLSENLQIVLYYITRASYQSLDIVNICNPFWTISHVSAGSVETTTRGERVSAPAGTVMLHPPNLLFSEYAEGPGTHEYFFCDATIAANLDLFRLYPVSLGVPLISPSAWSDVFAKLQLSTQARGDLPNLSAYGLTAQLLGMLLESWRQMGSPPRPQSLDTHEDRFTSLIQYMTDNLGEKLGREELASRACLHPGYFNRVFRETYGIPPMQMLRDLRLSRVKRHLEDTDETLETIAERCGFEDAAYLSRVFHKQIGMPPGQYRTRTRESVKNARKSYSGALPSEPGPVII